MRTGKIRSAEPQANLPLGQVKRGQSGILASVFHTHYRTETSTIKPPWPTTQPPVIGVTRREKKKNPIFLFIEIVRRKKRRTRENRRGKEGGKEREELLRGRNMRGTM
jgi:hypothetical protein